MALIKWDDSLSVNVVEIDKQHQKLVGMINDLNDAMRERKGKDVLGKIITSLIDYTVSHFSTEEKYFDQFGYTETVSHKKKHSKFTQKVSAFKTKFDTEPMGLSIEVINFLSDWLQNHIMTIDKKYGPFFNEKGLK